MVQLNYCLRGPRGERIITDKKRERLVVTKGRELNGIEKAVVNEIGHAKVEVDAMGLARLVYKDGSIEKIDADLVLPLAVDGGWEIYFEAAPTVVEITRAMPTFDKLVARDVPLWLGALMRGTPREISKGQVEPSEVQLERQEFHRYDIRERKLKGDALHFKARRGLSDKPMVVPKPKAACGREASAVTTDYGLLRRVTEKEVGGLFLYVFRRMDAGGSVVCFEVNGKPLNASYDSLFTAVASNDFDNINLKWDVERPMPMYA